MDKEEGFAPDLTYLVFIHSAFLPSLNHTYIHTYIHTSWACAYVMIIQEFSCYKCYWNHLQFLHACLLILEVALETSTLRELCKS